MAPIFVVLTRHFLGYRYLKRVFLAADFGDDDCGLILLFGMCLDFGFPSLVVS